MKRVHEASIVNAWRIANRASLSETSDYFGISRGTVRNYWIEEITPERMEIAKELRRRHGMSKSAEHHTWTAMHARCRESAEPSKRARYFERGITVCERWNVFENFLLDMGLRPSPNHSIDRIDVNGNYEPDNCRWATLKEQCRNRRSNKLLTAFGETKTVVEWSEDPRCSVSLLTLASRSKRNVDHEWMISAPAKWVGQPGHPKTVKE